MPHPGHTDGGIGDRPLAVGIIGPPGARAGWAARFAAAGLRVCTFEFVSACGSDLGAVIGTDPNTSSISEAGTLGEQDVLVVCVPVELTAAGGANTIALVQTARVLSGELRQGQLVLLTGAVPPGTTRRLLLPALLNREGPHRDVLLAYATPLADSIPCAVGGLDAAAADAAAALFARAEIHVRPVSSPEAAEVSGAVEAAARVTLAALANQMRAACAGMALDPWEVLATSGTALVPTLGEV